MVRTRIRNEQGEDIGFVSEREFNDFFADVVITGTNDATDIITTFDNYLPNRGIFVGADGNVVTTGTNTINITGFYAEFVSSSGSLQGDINILESGAAGVSSLNTITGTVTIAPGTNVTVVDNVPAGIITISATAAEADAIVGAGEVAVISGTGVVIVSGTPHTINTDTISNAIIGGDNITVVSGANTTTISSNATVANAIVGAGEVVVISGANETIVSGTPHTINTDDISDAIIGGVGIVVTSGSNETTIDGHLRYTKDENDAIIGGENVTVVSGVDTITISSVDTISDAVIGGVGITVTSGSNEITVDGHLRYQKNENDALLGTDGNTVISGSDTITIQGFRPEFVAASGSLQDQIDAVEGSDVDSVNALIGDVLIVDGVNSTATTNVGANSIQIDTFDDDDVDSITASGVTVTGSVQFETLGGLSVTANASTDTVTISGGSEVGELIGSLFQIEFTNGGNTSNTWLAVSDSNLSGNSTPWTACFPCRLAGLAFSNRNDGVNIDLEFHVARFGDGNTSAVEIIYEVRDARTSFKTDIPLDGLVLDPGDKISVFASNAGSSARDVWFGAYVEIISRTTAEGVENWTGDIS